MWLSLGMCAKLFAPGRICFACQVFMSWSCCRSSLFILLLFGWSIFSVTDFFKWGNESKGGGVLVQLKELMWKAGQERNMYQSFIPLYVLCVDILLVYLSNQILAVLGGNSLWVYNWIVVLRPCLQCDSRWNNRAHECQFEGIRSHFLGILLRLTVCTSYVKELLHFHFKLPGTVSGIWAARIISWNFQTGMMNGGYHPVMSTWESVVRIIAEGLVQSHCGSTLPRTIWS